ncbi:hypothetical protein [Spiroplasma endosymbiont of Nebria brevicollis]|uniref:hypothetical protein n=1 Tax=Spiroplasma endosymbiont of Nebria brevicollis TaxID=3066284 RepID=UPI00313D8943
MECKDKKCKWNYELITTSIDYRIEFLQNQIEKMKLNKFNLWELDVLRGQIKSLNEFKEVLIKGEMEND